MLPPSAFASCHLRQLAMKAESDMAEHLTFSTSQGTGFPISFHRGTRSPKSSFYHWCTCRGALLAALDAPGPI